MDKRSAIYLPIETKSREYLAKLLLGCFLSEGNTVYIGERTKMRNRMGIMPCGIFIEKGIGFAGDKWMFEFLQRHQHVICGWEEEGLMFEPERFKLNFGKKSFSMLESFFCWGEYVYNTIKSIDESYIKKMVKSGNPRFDLLDKRIRHVLYKNEKINERPYILINTSFSLSNNIDTDDVLNDIMIPHYIKNDCTAEEREAQICYFKDAIMQSSNNFRDFADLARYLAELYREYDIVIRPHPSESIHNWEKEVRGFNNIKIIQNRTANEWSYNSIAVIHVNCTTGVEAYLMDKPVIAYLKNEQSIAGFDLANSLSITAYTKEEIVELLNSILAGEDIHMRTQERENILSRYYYCNDSLASELITEKINSLRNKIKRRSFIQIIGGIYSFLYYNFKQFMLRVLKIIPWNNSYFPGLTTEEVRNDILKYSAFEPRFKEIKVAKVTNNIFKLSR